MISPLFYLTSLTRWLCLFSLADELVETGLTSEENLFWRSAKFWSGELRLVEGVWKTVKSDSEETFRLLTHGGFVGGDLGSFSLFDMSPIGPLVLRLNNQDIFQALGHWISETDSENFKINLLLTHTIKTLPPIIYHLRFCKCPNFFLIFFFEGFP